MRFVLSSGSGSKKLKRPQANPEWKVHLNLNDYYSEPAVRRRMLDFVGGTDMETTPCAYITADERSAIPRMRPRHPNQLWMCLDHGLEVKRSLWDFESLVVHLDIEYVNFEYPAEPYIDPERSLELQQPVIRDIQERLLALDITPLHLLSGRGHHLVWRVRRNSDTFRRLGEIGFLLDTLRARADERRPPRNIPVGLENEAAFAGIGQVLEFFAQEAFVEMQSHCSIEVRLTEVETSRGRRGREIVCVDLSEYGDPLHTRMIGIPFSAYHKVQQRRAALGTHAVDGLPPMFLIPLFEMDFRWGALVMRDPLQTARLAAVAPTSIPDQTAGTARLVGEYESSRTAEFHRWFYSQEHEKPNRWPETYDRIRINSLQASARTILNHPNDLLLKPAGMRHVVRVLLGLGWHPRHVAGLIRSKFERDFGWGDMFYHYDAAMRADFYTRLFSGMIALGLDDLEDFDVEELSATGLAPRDGSEENGDDVAECRESLLQRRNHERLASRPIHGLFLPNESVHLP